MHKKIYCVALSLLLIITCSACAKDGFRMNENNQYYFSREDLLKIFEKNNAIFDELASFVKGLDEFAYSKEEKTIESSIPKSILEKTNVLKNQFGLVDISKPFNNDFQQCYEFQYERGFLYSDKDVDLKENSSSFYVEKITDCWYYFTFLGV